MSLVTFNWQVPVNPLGILPPNDLVSEDAKTPDWYAEYSRWIVATFYNQSRQIFNPTQFTRGIALEAIDNWSYVFSEQTNYKYNYLQQTYSGDTVGAVWVPGSKTRELVKYLEGKALVVIGNLTPSVKNLTRDVASKQAAMYDKLLAIFEAKEILQSVLPDGVSMNPVGNQQEPFDTTDDIDNFISKWQDEYSIMATRISESQIVGDMLAAKFRKCALHQIVGGLSGVHIKVENGKVCNEVVPSWELIWDNRQDDDGNSLAMVCGKVKHNVPYQDVLRMFQHSLSPEEMEEIRTLAIANVDNTLNQFFNYYNSGFNNGLVWWKRTAYNQMTISYAQVYFIAPRKFPFTYGNNRYGKERVKKVDATTNVSGDFSGYDLYTCTIIGNKYVTDFGLANDVLRPYNDMGKPQLPIRIFADDMQFGYSKPIVSILKPKQDYLDALSFKIWEKIGKDYGRVYVINGSKLDTTSTELLADLKTLGVYVAKGNTGESDDPTNNQRMVEQMDMTLDSDIVRYSELKIELEREMNNIVSVSEIALGQQQNTIGKAVQANTINQNSYGTATLFDGLMKFYEDVLQYNLNLKQMLYSYTDSVDESLTIGEKGSYLLRIMNPREFGSQQFKLFVQLNNSIDGEQRQRIRDIAFNEAQNGRMTTLDYIKNVERADSLDEMVKGIEYSQSKMQRQAAQAEQANTQMQMQHEAAMQEALLKMQAALQQNRDDNENFRAELKATVDMLKAGIPLQQSAQVSTPVQPPESPLTIQMQPQPEGQPQQQPSPVTDDQNVT